MKWKWCTQPPPKKIRQAVKQFAYIFIHLKSCVEKKKNQRNEHSLSLQPIIFPSTQNILINRKNSYNSMYKRKPKWNLSLTDHFNRNVRVGRLRIIYTQQNIDKLAFNVTKGKKRNLKNRKRNLFDFMSALWGVPVVKVRQKSDHKHWKTILVLISVQTRPAHQPLGQPESQNAPCEGRKTEKK